jgi:PAS domain S-box-containing protein
VANAAEDYTHADLAVLQRLADFYALAIKRHHTDQMLRESRERHRLLVEHAPMGIALSTYDGRLITCNEWTAHITGYSCAELRQRDLTEAYVNPDDRRRLVRLVQENGTVHGFETLLRKMRDEQYTARLHARQVSDQGEDVMLVIVEDITERKQTEKALRAERDFSASILHGSPIMITGLTTDGKIVFVNAASARLAGRQPETLTGVYWWDLLRPVASSWEPAAFMQELTQADLHDREISLVARDGTERTIMYSTLRRFDADDRVVGIIVFAYDVTRHKQMQRELEIAQRIESMSKLAGGLVGELNDLLVAIAGNVSLARLCISEGKDARSLLTSAESASLDMRELLQQLLVLSRQDDPEKRTTAISDLLMDVATFALRGSNVWCQFQIAHDLWPASVDTGQISQAIHSIVASISQSISDGECIEIGAENVKVSAHEMPLLSPGPYVQVAIRDHGPSIAREDVPGVFEPYFPWRKGSGGRELSEAYALIRANGGHITVGAEVGFGNVFRIYLPAHVKTTYANPEVEYACSPPSGAILVVDDAPLVLDTASAMLRHLGYEVVTAGSADEAISQCVSAVQAGNPFAMAILDSTLPGDRAWRAVMRRWRNVHPDLPVVVSSNIPSDSVMLHYAEHGFQDAIGKPYNLADLRHIVQRTLGRNAATSPVEPHETE